MLLKPRELVTIVQDQPNLTHAKIRLENQKPKWYENGKKKHTGYSLTDFVFTDLFLWVGWGWPWVAIFDGFNTKIL